MRFAIDDCFVLKLLMGVIDEFPQVTQPKGGREVSNI